MKTIPYRALAVVCLVTFSAAGCARNPVTGPEAPPAGVVSTDLEGVSDASAPRYPRRAEAVEKVTICHIPPGNPENAHTITVGAPAVAAHIANHGDYLGECIIHCATGKASDRFASAVCHIGR